MLLVIQQVEITQVSMALNADKLQGCAGCTHLCGEGLSREHGNAEEEDVPLAGAGSPA